MSFKEILDKIIHWITTEGVRLVLALFILYLTFKLINFLAKRLENRIKKKKKHLDETITRVGLSAFRKVLKFLAFVCFLGYIGIETSSIAAAITSIGLGIGLALQGSLANFAGGVIVLVMRPYKLGDYIECNGVSGTVEDIKLFYTYIVTIDNKVITMPNGKVADSLVINYSSKKLRRLDMLIDVNKDSDLLVVKKAIRESIEKSNMYYINIVPFININSYKKDSIEIVLKVWCDNDKYWDLYYFLLEEIKREFDINGIGIPNNKMDVFIKNK